MLRVCGITFDRTNNYGSCLQAYALKTAVEKVIINGEGCEYSLLALGKAKDRVNKGLIRNRIAYIIARPPFYLFERKHMRYEEINTLATIEKLNDKYDAFVCGSDVIWNPDFNNRSDIYFLQFANKYSFSYGASFGKAKLDHDYVSSLKYRLSRLKQISVRENSARDLINEYTNYSVCTVVDPVLLLDVDEWDSIAGDTHLKDDYIYVYATHITPLMESFCERLHKLTGLRIKRTTCHNLKYSILHGDYLPSPERWIQYIRDARYVVTNSFHATVFSTIFNKDFFTVVDGVKNGGINVRVFDYLNSLGLEDRIINNLDADIALENVCYNEFKSKSSGLRAASLLYLRTNLEMAYAEKKANTQI